MIRDAGRDGRRRLERLMEAHEVLSVKADALLRQSIGTALASARLGPPGGSGLLRYGLPLPRREHLRPRLATLSGPERRQGLGMRVLPLGRFQNGARGLLDDPKGILGEVRALAAPACSRRHDWSMPQRAGGD